MPQANERGITAEGGAKRMHGQSDTNRDHGPADPAELALMHPSAPG